MKRGVNCCWRMVIGVGVNPSWRSTQGQGQHQIAGVKGGAACSVGIWSERVEAGEGGGRSFYLDACGRLGRRDERTEGSAVYLSFARLGASR